jgi:hypothetical protein
VATAKRPVAVPTFVSNNVGEAAGMGYVQASIQAWRMDCCERNGRMFPVDVTY